MARRIQRKRTRGWRMPKGAVYVGRPTKFGNPFAVGEKFDAVEEEGGRVMKTYVCSSPEEAVECFRNYVDQDQSAELRDEIRAELRGRDLACWCRLDQPCHADVLLELANAEAA